MLALVMAAAAGLPPQWNDWKYERRIDVAGRTGTVSVVVPPSLYGNAQRTLDDVRVVSRGKAVPFAIATPPAPSDARWIEARLRDTGYVKGRYSQAVGDFGRYDAPIDMLEVVTPQQSFAANVQVEASDDGQTWRTVVRSAPIYDYARDGLATNLRIAIPSTTSRYIRLRVDNARPFAFEGLRAAEGANEPRMLERYPVTIAATDTSKRTATYDLAGLGDVPIERVDVTSSTPAYARASALQSNEGNGWQTVQSATLERSPQRTRSAIRFDESQAQRWRLAIEDGDNSPLSTLTVYAYGAPRRIVFDARPGAAYALVYGNPSAPAPLYDYAQTHARAIPGAPAVALGAPLVNPSFVPEAARRPWTERNRWLLWSALGIVALALAVTALRVLRGGAAEQPNP